MLWTVIAFAVIILVRTVELIAARGKIRRLRAEVGHLRKQLPPLDSMAYTDNVG